MTSNKIINIFTFDGIDLKCDCFEASFKYAVTKSIVFSFALYRLPGFKKFREGEKIDKKIRKSTLKKSHSVYKIRILLHFILLGKL